jgi:hypothetical protein
VKSRSRKRRSKTHSHAHVPQRKHMGTDLPKWRRSRRFPIQCTLLFKTWNGRSPIFTGNGETLNVSSSGVLFKSHCDLPVGRIVELVIDWPVRLNDNCFLKLVARGRVVRHQNGQFAVKVERYNFRKETASSLRRLRRFDQVSSHK